MKADADKQKLHLMYFAQKDQIIGPLIQKYRELEHARFLHFFPNHLNPDLLD